MEHDEGGYQSEASLDHRRLYQERMLQVRTAFERSAQQPLAGRVAARSRADIVDELIRVSWRLVTSENPALATGVSLTGVGGYGRQELFPFSDVDLMFTLDSRAEERSHKEGIRRLNQLLWDAGLRISAMTRTLAECGRFNADNVEFTLSLLNARAVAGDADVAEKLTGLVIPKLVAREQKKIAARLLDVTRRRNLKYGDTLFHLEPNIKECPGGLRDVHVCSWLTQLSAAAAVEMPSPEFLEACDFLFLVRTFLHFRHQRDDNTLDWESQDAAALARIGVTGDVVDAAYWMRQYFRHARAVRRRTLQAFDGIAPAKTLLGVVGLAARGRRSELPESTSFHLAHGRIALSGDAARDPESVFATFAAVAQSGVPLAPETEQRIERAIPFLSANLEDGASLWRQLRGILLGQFAGRALRAMHALGVLELVLPEFHGIDALVIRDAYHRYTVDEHTFVLIDTLHGLGTARARPPEGAEEDRWAARFQSIFRDLEHPDLLFLAALLHDTGKGHVRGAHAVESARLAQSVVDRLDLDPYEGALVIELIRDHLEMSAALRRDVFDAETIRSFAARVTSPEALRMLTLFTYADIAAVHPDALTPWKAENLWRLYMATANYQDRSVDDERVPSASESELSDVLYSVHGMLRERRVELAHFLEGFPLRYLHTRSPDHIRTHFQMASRLGQAGAYPDHQIDFRYAPDLSEVTLITRDRPMLFAGMAGVLAAWGMNIVTADAFSNAHGVVVDSFRFADSYRTLELNESERERFLASLHEVIAGRTDVEQLLGSRKRIRRNVRKMRVESRIDFDDSASTQSTLLQVVAQDTPGLLRALSFTIAEFGCSIEVALIDTEGETAIDVFYITRSSGKLDAELQVSLRTALLEAIERNAQ